MNTGHGHVTPRPDGTKARCGGPGLCAQCSQEAATAAYREVTEPKDKEPARCPNCGAALEKLAD